MNFLVRKAGAVGEVLASDGDELWKWTRACRTELDNLKDTGTVPATSSERREERCEAKEGLPQHFVEFSPQEFSRSNQSLVRAKGRNP